MSTTTKKWLSSHQSFSFILVALDLKNQLQRKIDLTDLTNSKISLSYNKNQLFITDYHEKHHSVAMSTTTKK